MIYISISLSIHIKCLYMTVPLQRTILLGLRSVALVSVDRGALVFTCLAEDHESD